MSIHPTLRHSHASGNLTFYHKIPAYARTTGKTTLILIIAHYLIIFSTNAQSIASPSRFSVCSNHGCRKLTTIYYFDRQWQLIRKIFSAKSDTTEQERQRIAIAVGLMEQLVAPYSDTADDKGKNQIFTTEGRTDCVDESTNTTTYLTMMQNDGLLTHHVVGKRAYRLFSHYTATIQEQNTQQLYAVDSWFFDNGAPPVIIRLEKWLAGFTPDKQPFDAQDAIIVDNKRTYATVEVQEYPALIEH